MKLELKMYVRKYNHIEPSEDDLYYLSTNGDNSEYSIIIEVRNIVIDFEVPSKNVLVSMEIDCYRDTIKELEAECEIEVMSLKGKIQNLLALPQL